MRFADIKYNDIVDIDEGIAVSYWAQGCPFHCKNCHNPQTWDFNGGKEKDIIVLTEEINDALHANGIWRNFSVLGGEPLAPENVDNTALIIACVRAYYDVYHPEGKIFIWTGYTYEELKDKPKAYSYILQTVDVLIDGQYEDENRDITLKLRGSPNQRVIDLKKTNETKEIVYYN